MSVTLPEIRSTLLGAEDALGELIDSLDCYRALLPTQLRYGLREARLRTEAALACLDGLDCLIEAALFVVKSQRAKPLSQG